MCIGDATPCGPAPETPGPRQLAPCTLPPPPPCTLPERCFSHALSISVDDDGASPASSCLLLIIGDTAPAPARAARFCCQCRKMECVTRIGSAVSSMASRERTCVSAKLAWSSRPAASCSSCAITSAKRCVERCALGVCSCALGGLVWGARTACGDVDTSDEAEYSGQRVADSVGEAWAQLKQFSQLMSCGSGVYVRAVLATGFAGARGGVCGPRFGGGDKLSSAGAGSASHKVDVTRRAYAITATLYTQDPTSQPIDIQARLNPCSTCAEPDTPFDSSKHACHIVTALTC